MPVSFEEKILSVTEARQQFSSLLDEVRSGTPVVIHQPRHADVTMVPRTFVAHLIREVEKLTLELESLELASDRVAVAAIQKSEEDVQAGRTVTLADAARVLKERRHGRDKR
jgi:PHD/YefM family antitoxin component YafN of YafNO toxin-antitoxin module